MRGAGCRFCRDWAAPLLAPNLDHGRTRRVTTPGGGLFPRFTRLKRVMDRFFADPAPSKLFGGSFFGAGLVCHALIYARLRVAASYARKPRRRQRGFPSGVSLRAGLDQTDTFEQPRY